MTEEFVHQLTVAPVAKCGAVTATRPACAPRAQVFTELVAERIDFKGMVLKPNMVISGKECSSEAEPQ